MKPSNRPLMVNLFTLLLVLAATAMAYLGLSAAGYFASAACLLLQAALLWFGRGKALFASFMILNQLSGLMLVLVLGFGDGLGDQKLDISAAALLLNVATGGPLMSALSLPLLGFLQFGSALNAWFGLGSVEKLEEALSI